MHESRGPDFFFFFVLFSSSLHGQILTPQLLGNLDLKTDLGPLLLHREVVALHGAAEAALVRQAELVESLGAVCRGLLDTANDLLLVVQLRRLAAHDAQHDHLAIGQMPQRAEIARSRIVVLEEVHIDIQLLEERLSHGLVAALREPLAAVVAAAQVDANGHVLGPLGNGAVDELGVLLGQLGGVLAVASGGLLAHLVVAQVGQVGVVELDKAASSSVQVGNLLLVDAHEILKEGLQGRVGVLVDGLTAATEVHHGRRGDADLGGGLASLAEGFYLGCEELVVVDLDGLGVAQLAGHDQTRGRLHADLGDVG